MVISGGSVDWKEAEEKTQEIHVALWVLTQGADIADTN
jgi:hypothetical protein